MAGRRFVGGVQSATTTRGLQELRRRAGAPGRELRGFRRRARGAGGSQRRGQEHPAPDRPGYPGARQWPAHSTARPDRRLPRAGRRGSGRASPLGRAVGRLSRADRAGRRPARGRRAIGQRVAQRGGHADRAGAPEGALQERFEQLDGYRVESQIATVLAGLGFREGQRTQPVHTFSGGWQMRIALAKLLIRPPGPLLLDEPTNHLELAAVEWLEEYLRAFHGAAIVVSHDRYFLDRVVTRTLALERGSLVDYRGNYLTIWPSGRGGVRRRPRRTRDRSAPWLVSRPSSSGSAIGHALVAGQEPRTPARAPGARRPPRRPNWTRSSYASRTARPASGRRCSPRTW